MLKPINYLVSLLLAGGFYCCEGNEKMEEFPPISTDRIIDTNATDGVIYPDSVLRFHAGRYPEDITRPYFDLDGDLVPDLEIKSYIRYSQWGGSYTASVRSTRPELRFSGAYQSDTLVSTYGSGMTEGQISIRDIRTVPDSFDLGVDYHVFRHVTQFYLTAFQQGDKIPPPSAFSEPDEVGEEQWLLYDIHEGTTNGGGVTFSRYTFGEFPLRTERFLTFHWEKASGNLVGWVQLEPNRDGLLVNSFAVYRDEE